MEQIPDIGARGRRRRVFVFFGAFVLIMFLGTGVFFSAQYYRYRQEYLLPMERYNLSMDMFRNDTYGGKTPEETLQLFVQALREGDVEKASLYFTLDDNGSRERWVKYLSEVQGKNLLSVMADDIEKEAKLEGAITDRRVAYAIDNADGTVAVTIDIIFNGKVWKIERL